MNKHVESRAPKAEPKPYAKRPAGAGQIGLMYGNKVTYQGQATGYTGERLDRGRGYAPPQGPTDNVAACGVGGGRKVYASGSQGTQGSVDPGSPRPVPREHIIESFGPTYRRPSGGNNG
jgi:hypothetical protein